MCAAKKIVQLRVPILVLAVLLLIPSVFGMANTRINYDMLTYLPEDMETVIGQVGQHVIIDSCIRHSEHGRNEQQHREHQDRHSKPYNLFC